jgi:hypothetical protein
MTLTDRLSWSTLILGPAIATFSAQVFGISLFARQLKEAFFSSRPRDQAFPA